MAIGTDGVLTPCTNCGSFLSKHSDTRLMTLSILIGKEGTNVKTVPAATTKKRQKNKNNNKRSTSVLTIKKKTKKNKQTSKGKEKMAGSSNLLGYSLTTSV